MRKVGVQFIIVGLNSTFSWTANGVAAKYTTQVLVQHAKNNINSPSTNSHLVHFGFFFFFKKKKSSLWSNSISHFLSGCGNFLFSKIFWIFFQLDVNVMTGFVVTLPVGIFVLKRSFVPLMLWNPRCIIFSLRTWQPEKVSNHLHYPIQFSHNKTL